MKYALDGTPQAVLNSRLNVSLKSCRLPLSRCAWNLSHLAPCCVSRALPVASCPTAGCGPVPRAPSPSPHPLWEPHPPAVTSSDCYLSSVTTRDCSNGRFKKKRKEKKKKKKITCLGQPTRLITCNGQMSEWMGEQVSGVSE